MQNTNFLHLFNYTKDDKVVAYSISAIPYSSKNWIATEFMCGGEFLKVGVALFNSISKFCRSLRVFKLKGDIFERIEQIGVGLR